MRLSRILVSAGLLIASSAGSLRAQTPISAGQTLNGRLERSDPTLSDDSHYDDYVFSAQAGQQLVITMRSRDFDTYLQLGQLRGGSFERIDSDDDGGGGTDSQISYTASSAGNLIIRANSLAGGETGAYSLEVRASGTAQAPAAGSTPTISAGQTINGRLDNSDPQLSDDSRYDDYVYNGQAGEVIVITLRSSDFDAYLQWGRGAGAGFVREESNDDGGGGTDSELRVTLTDAGPYIVRANSLFGGETGAYTLTVNRVGGGATAGADGTIGPNQQVAGRLERGDQTLGDGSYYDLYTYRGQPGEEILITLTSDAFDAYLRVGEREGNNFVLTDSNDDGAGGTNAQLQVRVPASGIYLIQANSYSEGETGSYTLAIQTVGSGGAGSGVATIAAGQTINGQFTSSDPTLSDNSHYRIYQYRGTPGEQITVTLRSSDFDAYLSGGGLVNGSLNVETSDDDGAGNRDARITATIGPAGVYGIRANTLYAGETGRYTLTVESSGGGRPAPVAVPAGSATVAVGQTIQGTLANGDELLSDDTYFDQYVLQGTPNQQVEVTLTSSDFDAYLYGGRLNGGTFVSQTSDDDGAGGRNARIVVTIGSDGLYAVRANAFSPGETGRYALSVMPFAASAADDRRSGAAGKWTYVYDSAAPALRNAATRMKESQAFEQLVASLNERFTLPRPLTITGEECGFINAYYSPSDEAITFCYELYEMLSDIFVPDGQWTLEQREAVDGAMSFILMHEVGHAFVDVYDLPITGREEDAVDQLATMVLIDGSDKGATAALNGVLALQPGANDFDDSDFADEHSLGPVRLYNVMCWIFGSDPDRYARLVVDGMLPQERAVRCPSEYEQLSKSWRRLLQGNMSYLR